MHMERKKMRAADVEESLLRAASGSSSAAAEPGRIFATGHSVPHWWSSWFKTATEPKMQLEGKEGRPAWFDASIVAALEPQAIRYAGTMWPEGPVYQVH